MSRYPYVLLDADGTLFDFIQAEEKALKGLFAANNLAYDRAIKDAYHAINQGLWLQLEQGEITEEDLQNERFTRLFKSLGITADGRAVNDQYLTFLAQGGDLLPGALSVCRTLAEKSKLVLVTNGIAQVQRGRLKKSPLKALFSHVFVSEDTGFRKPHRGYFDYCFHALGDPELKSMLMVGDSLTSDMAGGIAAGIDTCWLNPDDQPVPEGMPITYEIKTLYELIPIVTGA
jgi:2-haloacid dehalogenase